MAVSINQQVDLLYKLAFGVTKTDDANNKSASNESIASPALIRGDQIWSQSGSIPTTAAALSGIVQAYLTTNAIKCTADNTTVSIGGVYPTWKTGLTNWIPTQFGSTYQVSVYADTSSATNPASTGTQLFPGGEGGANPGEWYFNYQSGVLNFIGETIPPALTSGKVIYITGYRYIGNLGTASLSSGTAIGNITLTGANISVNATNSNLNLSGNGTGAVVANANLYANNFIANSGVYSDNLYYANGTVWDFAKASGSANYIQFSNGTDLTSDANLQFDGANANLNVIGNINVGTGSNIQLLANGTIVANNFSGNFAGNISANISNIGANLDILYNYGGNVTSNTGFQYTPALDGGQITAGNSVTSNYFIGKFDSTSNSQPNITSLGNLTSLQVGTGSSNVIIDGSGNITTGAIVSAKDGVFSGNLSVNGTTTFVNSTVTALTDPLLYLGGAANNANLSSPTTSDTGLYLHNYYSSNPNNQFIGWSTGGSEFKILTSATITGGVVSGTYANIHTGNANLGNLATANYFAGTLTTSSQPNITSTGILTSLQVSGLANVSQLQVGTVTYPNVNASRDGQYLKSYANGTVYYGSLDTSMIANGTSNIEVYRDGNIEISVAGTANTVTFATDGSVVIGSGTGGNIDGVNVLNANIVNANTANLVTLEIGNSQIQSITATTSATSMAILANINISAATGIEFIIKGLNSTSGKYSVATLLAVADYTGNIDYTTYGIVHIGGTTGILGVQFDTPNSNIQLTVTPSISTSTTWVTQYRTI